MVVQKSFGLVLKTNPHGVDGQMAAGCHHVWAATLVVGCESLSHLCSDVVDDVTGASCPGLAMAVLTEQQLLKSVVCLLVVDVVHPAIEPNEHGAVPAQLDASAVMLPGDVVDEIHQVKTLPMAGGGTAAG